MVDETENAIHYVWSIMSEEITKREDYNVDVMIVDASDIHHIPLEIKDVTTEIRSRLLEKLLVVKYMLPTEKIDILLEELDININQVYLVEDFLNKCSNFLDTLVNYYIPATGNTLLFSDHDILATDDLDKGIWLNNIRWVGNEDSNKLLLSFAIFRKRGVL